MLLIDGINGQNLPNKTLSLTFDDGPGESIYGNQTLKIAKYLYEENIKATFFLVGKHAINYPEVLKKLKHFGHLIGNHSYNHPNFIMDNYNTHGLLDEINSTNKLFHHWVDGKFILFRPPYGNWDEAVAMNLNKDLFATLINIGPIHWDIDEADHDTWNRNLSLSDLINRYYNKILQSQKGIVLMHDSSADQENAKNQNRCLSLVKDLIPKLKSQGFKFIRLDEIKEISNLIMKNYRVSLLASNEKFVSFDSDLLIANKTKANQNEYFSIDFTVNGKIAIKCANGKYLSAEKSGGGRVLTDGPKINTWEVLEVVSIGEESVAFKTNSGHYLTLDESNIITAKSTELNKFSVFHFSVRID